MPTMKLLSQKTTHHYDDKNTDLHQKHNINTQEKEIQQQPKRSLLILMLMPLVLPVVAAAVVVA
jgi:hypothetical protein